MEDGDDKITCLYKYRPINENTLKILISHELFFSFPSGFNDPFDCRLNIIAEGNDDDIKKWLDQVPRTEFEKQAVFHNIKTGKTTFSDIINSLQKDRNETITVFCLSQKYDNILMWSHYANSHKGICLGFKTTIWGNSLCIKFQDENLKKMGPLYFEGNLPAVRVKYDNVMPLPYNLLQGDSDGIRPFILTKCQDWNYEEERRLILFHKLVQKHTIKYPIETLSEVYFGCETSDKEMFDIVKIVKEQFIDKGINIKFYKMKLSANEYKLDKVDLNI